MIGEKGPLGVLIVDDEAPARRLLRRLLLDDPEVSVIGECADGRRAVDMIVEERPDLVFLDIQIPVIDGFAVIQAVGPSVMPAVIFVTAFDRYAVKAFDAHALDYLLKPFSQARFALALSRAKHLLHRSEAPQQRRLKSLLHDWQYDRQSSQGQARRSEFRQQIFVKDRHRIIRLELADILWLEAADHYVIAHTAGGRHLLPESLTSLESSLPPEQFVRIHRGAIVNVAHVQRISPARFGFAR